MNRLTTVAREISQGIDGAFDRRGSLIWPGLRYSQRDPRLLTRLSSSLRPCGACRVCRSDDVNLLPPSEDSTAITTGFGSSISG